MTYPLDADARSETIRLVPLPALERLLLRFQGGLGRRRPMQDTYRAYSETQRKRPDGRFVWPVTPRVVGRARLELATLGLKVLCSAN